MQNELFNIEINKIYNIDCMQLMKQMPDNFVDLAICDPPYGLNMGCGAGETRGKGKKKKDLYTPKKWDAEKPTVGYWKELFRVSKNQVIWGGNYFTDTLPVSRGWIYWRKMMGGNYSDGELAWTSFDMILKEYTKRSEQGDKRFHPTQKPVALYKWILTNYANKGDLIFDSHLGSASSIIACLQYDFDYIGCEIDKEYFAMAQKRIDIEKSQLKLY